MLYFAHVRDVSPRLWYRKLYVVLHYSSITSVCLQKEAEKAREGEKDKPPAFWDRDRDKGLGVDSWMTVRVTSSSARRRAWETGLVPARAGSCDVYGDERLDSVGM